MVLWRDFFGHDLSQPDPNDAGSAAVPPEKAGQPAPQIKTPKSKLKNPDVPPIPRETIAEAEVQPAPQEVGDKAREKAVPKIRNQKSEFKIPEAAPTIKNPNSKIKHTDVSPAEKQ